MTSEAYKRLMEKKKALYGTTIKIWSPSRPDEHTIKISKRGKIIHPKSCCNRDIFGDD